MAALGRFELLTFDCYGTLVDWEKGIVAALKPLLKKYGKELPAKETLETYAEAENRLEKEPYRPYRDILDSIVKAFGEKYQFNPSEDDTKILTKSLPNWPLFYDTLHALKKLRPRFKIAVLSNIDRELFAQTQKKLEIDFNWIVTSEDVQSYKPAAKHFEEILKISSAPLDKVLHIAQSIYHDIRPAKAVGLRTVWINRRRGLSGAGATIKTPTGKDDKPDLELPDLDTLADYLFHLTTL